VPPCPLRRPTSEYSLRCCCLAPCKRPGAGHRRSWLLWGEICSFFLSVFLSPCFVSPLDMFIFLRALSLPSGVLPASHFVLHATELFWPQLWTLRIPPPRSAKLSVSSSGSPPTAVFLSAAWRALDSCKGLYEAALAFFLLHFRVLLNFLDLLPVSLPSLSLPLI
jgi:hypothetical protein